MELGKSLGAYRIVARIGEGGMGEVYRARDTELERDVALKVLPKILADHADGMSRFRREAHLLAAVNHPNIATIHGFKEIDGTHFLVLELVEGVSLADLLAVGPLPVAEALHDCAQIALALEAAHKRGVIHRDLKPANVMVSPEGWVKVLDFGLAKALSHGPETETLATSQDGSDSLLATVTATADGSLTGGLLGTVPYMSPEQVRRQKLDVRTDIWAFGCVLFETLTGCRPFMGPTTIDTLSAILEREPPWELLPGEVPPAVRVLLGQCLQKDPETRLKSMSEVRSRLESATHSSPALTPGAGIPAPTTWTPGPQEASAASLGVGPATLSYLDSLGPYTVVERLAAGGYGELYRAWDRENERDVALKVLRPEMLADETARQGLRREAAALEKLHHPNIAEIYDFASAEGMDFLVTEYVAGTTLAARLASGALPEGAVTHLGAQIAAALSEAHGKGILHRDLKASNVLVTVDAQVKLVDFGLARSLSDESAPPALLSSSSEPEGTLPYRAPELLRGGEPDERSEIYSLGVLLYRMATGRWPFWGEDEREISEAILSRPPRPPGDWLRSLTPALEQLILKCLEKDPRDRFASAGEVAAELRALAPASHLPVARPTSRPAKRGAFPALAVAAVVAVVAALLAFVIWRWTRAPSSSLADVDSVVVMPSQLVNAEAYLADAIPNAISVSLSALDGLQAKLPPSSLEIERFGGDLSRIAEAYGAETMVLSTVSRQDERLVLSLQLVEAGSRNLLWGHQYEGDRTAYLDVARRGAEDLGRALRPDHAAAGPPPSTAASSEAEMLFQQGRYYSNLYRNLGRDGDKERAAAAFQRVLELDPERADAAAEIAVLHASSLDLGLSVVEVLPEIRSWAERAIDIDPKNGKAWAVLGYTEGGRQPDSYRRKLQYLLKGAAYEPSDGFAPTRLVGPLGNHSATLAVASSREASLIDPLVLFPPLFEAIYLAVLGRTEEGLARVDQVLGIEPDMPFGLWIRGLILAIDSHDQEALALISEKLDPLVTEGKLHPQWVAVVRDLATVTAASRAGDEATADAAAQRLLAMARGEMPFPRWDTVTTGIAAHLAHRGRREEALELLLFRTRQGIYLPYDHVLFHPDLKQIRDDPRFREALASLRTGFENMIAILDDSRSRGELPAYLEQPLADLLKQVRRARAEG